MGHRKRITNGYETNTPNLDIQLRHSYANFSSSDGQCLVRTLLDVGVNLKKQGVKLASNLPPLYRSKPNPNHIGAQSR